MFIWLQLYKQLIDKKSACNTEVLCNVDVNLANRYEIKLQSELKVLRQQAKENVKQEKKEFSDIFDNKVLMLHIKTVLILTTFILQIRNLQNELQCKNKSLKIAHEDLNVANIHISQLSQQINDLMVINNDCLVFFTF